MLFPPATRRSAPACLSAKYVLLFITVLSRWELEREENQRISVTLNYLLPSCPPCASFSCTIFLILKKIFRSYRPFSQGENFSRKKGRGRIFSIFFQRYFNRLYHVWKM